MDVYAEITARVLEALASGTAPWSKPWTSTAPTSASTGKAYRGCNWWTLRLVADLVGHKSHLWGTYNAWQKVGGKVRKGTKARERGAPVILWKWLDRKVTDRDGSPVLDEHGDQVVKTIPFARGFWVYNRDDVDGLPEVSEEPREIVEVEQAEQVIERYLATGPSLGNSVDRACYSPRLDEIRMPPRDAFAGDDEWYGTLYHECAHSTGHEDRLARLSCGVPMEHRSYAREELLAELAACMLASQTGVEPTVDNSAAYLRHWSRELQDDPRLWVTATQGASKAADWILSPPTD